MSSTFGFPAIPSYSSTKGAINALTRQVAFDYGSKGIRSNAIQVGFVANGDVSAMLAAHPTVGEAFRTMTLTRAGIAEDVSNAALYLASDESKFVTGVVLPVDGGLAIQSVMPDFSRIFSAS
ncbi:MAG: SDR family oxidoreductase [Sporichthya sp.]|nr:SDR family oxidoreductase [Sporichthya sp.]